MSARSGSTAKLLTEVRECNLCADHLPLGPKPVLQFDSGAKILIAGQAPGRRVHQTGVPFDDPSGDRLREWLRIDRERFYDERLVAILPMGFCYPGQGRSGDLPPRPECAQAWRAELMRALRNVEVTLVLGRYAMEYHLGKRYRNLTSAVADWREHYPRVIPLPHPSPRNRMWLKRNPWFEEELLPALRRRIAEIAGDHIAESEV